MAKVVLADLNRKTVKFRIRGTSPLIQHQWSEKAKQQMREKSGGRKTKTREARDPMAEAEACLYRTAEGEIGINGMAFKCSLISAAHKDIGIEKTLVRKAIFLVTKDPGRVLPMTTGTSAMQVTKQFCPCGAAIREDLVRVGVGSADLRYRPQFDEWAVDIELEIDNDLLQVEDILKLVNRAGFGVGIGEWRPEKSGEFGRFEIDDTVEVTVD